MYKEATKISMTPKTTNARETEKRGNRRPEDSARNGRTDTYSVVPSNIVTVKVNRYTCDEPQSKVISRQHRQASWNYLSDMMSMQDPQLRSLCLLATALVGEHIQMARPPVLTFMQSLFNARRSTFSHLFSLRSCNPSVTPMYKSFVVALVFIASAVSPAHSAAFRYIVLLLNLAIPADVFVAFVVASQKTLLLVMPPQMNAPFVNSISSMKQ